MFGQEVGKRVEVEGGPWEFVGDLLVFEARELRITPLKKFQSGSE